MNKPNAPIFWSRFLSFRTLRQILFAALALFVMTGRSLAIIAIPTPVELKQPDGLSITLRVRGDEFCHWFEDMNGYAVTRNQGQYVYAVRDAQGGLAPTTWVVGVADPVNSAGTIQGGPSPAFKQQQRAARLAATDAAQRPPAVPPVGVVKNLVLLCRFSDHALGVHTRAPADYTALMNAVGGDPLVAPTGSLLDYYRENSYGTMTLTSTVIAWVTLPQTEAYYGDGVDGFGNYPQNAQRMVEDALNAANATVNFGQFDADNDGFVDSIDIIHSGYAAETGFGGGDWIWSHRWAVPTPWSSGDLNGSGTSVKVFDYHTEAALWDTSGTNILRVGVVAHETGHFFGLPDLYDTDGSSEGIGSWCLMANSWGFDFTQWHPPHFSAWCKQELGFVVPTVIGAGTYGLPRAETIAKSYRVNHGYPGGEYLLIENRQPVGFETDMPQGGLAIWHIDETKLNNNSEGYPGQPGWPGNNNHFKVALLQADGLYQLEHGLNRGNAGDVYHGAGVSALGINTVPNTAAYQNGIIRSTSNIVSSISLSASNMTFILSTGDVTNGPAGPAITLQPVSQTVLAGANVSFSVMATGTPPLFYQWRSNNVPLAGAISANYNLLGVTTNLAAQYLAVVTNAYGSVTSAAATLTVTQELIGAAVYLRSIVGQPWGSAANEAALNQAFGAGNWQDLRFETVNVATLFSSLKRFIFMDGSHNGANELETFLTTHRTALQNWVAAGGLLILNSAPNEGDGMYFGFGVTLRNTETGLTAAGVSPAHPIVRGPFLPVGLAWTGSEFSRAYVTGSGLTTILTNEFGHAVLAEKGWGLGHVLFGGMTVPSLHLPLPEAANLRANLLAYGDSVRARIAYVRSTVGSPWNSTANETALDRAFGSGRWQSLRYEALNLASLLSPNTRFIFMEGGDHNANELEAFLTTNNVAISNWVTRGGALFLNSAPTEGNGLSFGFGVVLTNNTLTAMGRAAVAAHPIFHGPALPVGTQWSGTEFGRAVVGGPGLTALITNQANGLLVLAEKFVGAGHVLFGGLTTPNFHVPVAEAANLRANILAYGSAGLGYYSFANTNLIIIPDTGTAAPYPSTITIAGVAGLLSKVTVILSNINHTWPDDLDVLLVSPRGESIMLISDAGGSADLVNTSVIFDPTASLSVSDDTAIAAGSFLPTDIDNSDTLPAPAPGRPYLTTLGALNGSSPNGIWSLFVADDQAGDFGTISGWSLRVLTTIGRPILLPPRQVGLNVEVAFRSGTGAFVAADQTRFRIEGSGDLETWTTVPALLSLNAGVLQFTQPIGVHRFYRVVEP